MALLLLSGGVRVAYILKTFPPGAPSGMELERAAANVAREGSLGRIFSDDTGPSAHVAPLYPLFLGALYRVFGWNTSTGRYAQEFAVVITAVAGFALLPLVARETGRPPLAGWVAAFLLAVAPMNLWVETSGTWEQPYGVLALLGMLVLFCRVGGRGWRSPGTLIVTGVASGLTALLSPALLPAIALMCLGEFLIRPGQRRRVAAGVLVIGAAAGVTISPWVVRNYFALGGFVPLRSNFGLELAIGNSPRASGQTYNTVGPLEQSAIFQLHPFSNAEELEKLKTMGELPYMKAKGRAAVGWAAAHPLDAARLTLLRLRLYWFPGKDLWLPRTPFRGLKAFYSSLIALASLVQLACLARARRGKYWLLAAAVIGPSLIYMITHVDPRYRYPSYALCTLLTVDLLGPIALMLVRLVGVRPSAARVDGP